MSNEEIDFPENYERSALKDARGRDIHLDREIRIWLGKYPSECPTDEDWVVLRTAREACLLVLAGQVSEISLEDDLRNTEKAEKHERALGSGSEVLAFIGNPANTGSHRFAPPKVESRSEVSEVEGPGQIFDVLGKPIVLDESLSVYLDDLRPGKDGYAYVRTAREASLLSLVGEVENLSLDNDLGEPGLVFGEGRQVADFLAECFHQGRDALPSESLAIHSDNSVGIDAMRRTIQGLGNYGLEFSYEVRDEKPLFLFHA